MTNTFLPPHFTSPLPTDRQNKNSTKQELICYTVIMNEINQNSILLFHGSQNGLEDCIKPISRDLCDFGKGFYMGTEETQPLTLICNYPEAVLYKLELQTSNLNIREIPLGIDWALFVAFNRGRLTKELAPKLYEKYESYKNSVDIFKGFIANDRMFVVLDRFFDGDITDKALTESLSALKLGVQYVAVTQKACDAIKILSEKKLIDFERTKLKTQSELNRKAGVSLADEMCRKYRREGLYFDELIRE